MGSNTVLSRRQGDGNLVTPGGDQAVFCKVATVTIAQINAGYTIVDAIQGKQLRIVGLACKVTGGFTTADDIRVGDTAASPVVAATYAIAGVTDGAKFDADNTISNQTIGAGYAAALTVSKGIQVYKTGSAAAGGTSITFVLLYQIV